MDYGLLHRITVLVELIAIRSIVPDFRTEIENCQRAKPRAFREISESVGYLLL